MHRRGAFWLHCGQALVGLALIIGLFAIAPTRAEFRIDGFDVSDGLLQSRVTAVTEDSEGRMWVGSEAGLNLYDGYEFSEPDWIDSQHAHLTRSTTFGLYGQRAGEMWVATARGVSRIDLRNRQVTDVWHFQAHVPANLGRYRQAQFIETCDGAMLVARLQQVFHLVVTAEGIEQTLWLSADNPNLFLGDNSAFAMSKDEAGTVWIADPDRLWRVSCGEPGLTLVHDRRLDQSHASSYVALVADGEGRIFWASDHVISIVDGKSGATLSQMEVSDVYDFDRVLLGIAKDGAGGVLAASSHGLERWVWVKDTASFDISPLWVSPSLGSSPGQSFGKGLQTAVSGDGLVWAMSGLGVVVLSPKQGSVVQQIYDSGPPELFSPERINQQSEVFQTRAYSDRFGVVWLFGGLSGLSLYSPEQHRFQSIRRQNALNKSARSLQAVELDGQLFLWVSWDGDEVSLWRKMADNTFTQEAAFGAGHEQPDDPSLGMVRAMAKGQNGQVWLATAHAIWLADTRTRTIQHLHTFDVLASHIERRRYANIGLIYDPARQVLIYSHSNDVWAVSVKPDGLLDKVQHLDWLNLSLLLGAYVSLEQLDDGRLILGSTQGIRVADLDQQVWIDHTLGSGTGADPREVILSIEQDSHGLIWLGTRSGLARYSLSDDSQVLTLLDSWQKADGLADDTIYAIASTRANDIWVSTNRGLVQFEMDSTDGGDAIHRNFSLAEGLPNYEFNSRAITEDSEGHLYFGGINGIAWFQPLQMRPHPRAPDVVLQGLSVNEAPYPIGLEVPQLNLSHQENSLAVFYSGIHFSAKNKNQYSYQLEGHESNWVNAGQDRSARYSNLRPGTYRFWVKAANLDGVWSEPKLLLEAKIAPPPWATPWAYAMYVSSLFMALMGMAWSSNRRRRQLEVLVEKRTAELGEKNQTIEAQAKQLEEALEARTLFFANISHEFRTPLTLIQTAIEQLDPQQKHPKASQLAKHYIQRLTRLVDQLLDLSRLRLSGVEKASKPWSLNQVVALTLEGFEYLAKDKGIELTLELNDEFRTQVDQASVEKILLNLLTNAFKYTPSGGQVSLRVASAGQFIKVDIQDTGPGIAKDQQEMIFQRFERVPSEETLMREGAGIGLALVKEAAKAIGGSIELDSSLGQGSTFSLHLPGWSLPSHPRANSEEDPVSYLSGSRLQLDQALLAKKSDLENSMDAARTHVNAKPERAILIVEDNADLRNYLSDLLSDEWHVHQAGDGLQALEVLEQEDVDLILADIMMPHMDGLALLQRVRDNIDTSHVPFLLLSARHDTQTRLMGLTLAADDFLTKPFSPQELKLKLRNMVLARALLRSAILRSITQEDSRVEKEADGEDPVVSQDGQLSSRDHKFLERLNHWMADHYKDPDWSVVMMANQLAVTERTLQRKIRALTGMTPVNFVNQYRLSQAKACLSDPSLSIQEIAFDLGFGSQQSFSRAFKQAFSVTPTQWRQQQR